MLENWSLVLNILLLMGVLATIVFLMKIRKHSVNPDRFQPSLGGSARRDLPAFSDEIISVRQVIREESLNELTEPEPELKLVKKSTLKSSQERLTPHKESRPTPRMAHKSSAVTNTEGGGSLMMFLLAKENRQFAGYELLQTVLAAGLRFGEGQLFHRHQFASGQGPVLCSLASATASGVFDLQNIGAFSVRGLCLFMHTSQNPSIDAERFSIMLETASLLSEGLDAYLLDGQRQPLTEERIKEYYKKLHIEQSEFELEAASA